ncbi:Glycosyltransferase, GT2 family [Variovorax sp. PDC80]|uniref:glycosyltransferase n=1 Tax=Variovorax sp. PDC80 TaxID=1882827 RepID=UPI0008E74898|nr:glycosyltransferase [Variovorax sp. PDC80]SFP90263.1 Glycosyltransferase, GT2 family [Variovorax sp. PDC80]
MTGAQGGRPGDWPLVSIVIVNDNHAQSTVACLESIEAHGAGGPPVEVIVVDNASAPDDVRFLSDHAAKHRILRLQEQRFFEARNVAADDARGEFLLFLRHDVRATPGWLLPLVSALRGDPACGVVGPKQLLPDGTIHEAGLLIDHDGSTVPRGRYQPGDDARFEQMRKVDQVSGAALMVRKAAFDAVRGFDLSYEPGGGEDAELCLRIGHAGFATRCVPTARVMLAAAPDEAIVPEVQRALLARRWSAYLSTGVHDASDPAGSSVPAAAPAVLDAPTAALFTPYSLTPGGGERYLLGMAEVLLRAGYSVWLVTPERWSSLRIAQLADSLSLSLRGLRLITHREAEDMSRFDLFVTMGNEVAPPIAPLGRRNLYYCQFPFPWPAEDLERRRTWSGNYQAIVMNSPFARDHMRQRLAAHGLPEQEIHVLYPPVALMQPAGPDEAPRAGGIVSVGRFFAGGHCKRQDMLIRAFRDLYASGVRTELHLVGSLRPEPPHRAYLAECQRLAEGLPVHFHLNASPQALARIYADASVYWHGAGYEVDATLEPERCEHFGISVVEAMSVGAIPIVVGNGGPSATVRHGVNGFCYDTQEQLVELTRTLLAKPAGELAGMRRLARERAQDFSEAAFASRWRDIAR